MPPAQPHPAQCVHSQGGVTVPGVFGDRLVAVLGDRVGGGTGEGDVGGSGPWRGFFNVNDCVTHK